MLKFVKILILSLFLYQVNGVFCIQAKSSSIQIETNNCPQTEFFDSKSTHLPTSYIYSPGMMGSELLMGRYCPSFTASTGEQVIWKSGGHIIGQPHSSVIFTEIKLRKPGYFTLNPIDAILDNARNSFFPFIQRCFQDKFKFTVIDNPKSSKSVLNYSFDFGKANIGQKQDIKRLHKAYKQHIKQYSDSDVVLFGDSRGASTTFNFIAKYKPEKVKAAILDGIYDDIPHCIKHFIYIDKDEKTEEALHNLICTFFGFYSKKGPFPIQMADNIDDKIPLLLVTSLNDGLTTPQGAINLYVKLLKKGHKKVHLLILKKSLHPAYMIDDPQDRQDYQTVVHAFYKNYNLDHNSKLAQDGKELFEQTQPSIEFLNKNYNLAKCKLCQW